MAARFWASVPLTTHRFEPRPHLRGDRHRRQIGPVVEALEGRFLLAGVWPTYPVHAVPKAIGIPTPNELGAAYQQVAAIQSRTLRSLGDSYREVQAAGARFASRTAAAIDELTQVKSRQNAQAIDAGIRRNLGLLDRGGANVVREKQGLDVARGVENQAANTAKTDIVNGLFTNLSEFVEQNQSTGTAISRTGRRSENALVRQLNKLGDQLVSTIPVQTRFRN
jgi:hypothetical protein